MKTSLHNLVQLFIIFFCFALNSYAATTPYTDKATFLAQTGATSATGPIPNIGLVAVSPGDPGTALGSLTFSVAPGGSALFIGALGWVPGNDWYPPTPTNEMALNLEHMQAAVTAGTPIYSIGFDFIEPNATMPSWGGVPVESDYRIQLYRGATLVGEVTFSGASIPNDIVTFLGVTSDVPFDRVIIDDLTNSNDDEYFGEFFTSAIAPVASYNALGSFLLFPTFDIRANTATQLRVVNNGESNVRGHINFVCPGVKNVNQFCAALDTVVTFTPHQTRVIDVASSHPPCNQGYVTIYAQGFGGSDDTGGVQANNQPISYNFFSGSYQITSGLLVDIDNAISIQSPQLPGSILGLQGTLRFDGTDYYALHTTLATDFRSTRFGDDGTLGSRLTLLTLDIRAGMQNPPAVAAIDFWNAAEVPFSTSVEFICWTQKQLETIDHNFLEDNLGTTIGSMILAPSPNCPLPGGCPPFAPYDPVIFGQIEEFGIGSTAARSLSHDRIPKESVFQPR